MSQSQKDLQHFLKLASAQVRHRMKQADETPSGAIEAANAAATSRSLQLLEDLIKEQENPNEDSRNSISPAR